MSFPRQETVAIIGMGLICRRFDSVSHPPPRFITVDLPDAGASQRASRSVELAFRAAIDACDERFLSRENCGAAITISKGLIDTLEDSVVRMKFAEVGAIPAISTCGADAAAVHIARALRLGGPAAAAVAACASGLASIKLGMDWLRDGVCGTVLAGAAESSNSEMVLRSFERLGVISPLGSTRPFDVRRDGFVVGEGAAVFRLESYDRAQFNAARGKGPEILGKILAIALGADGHHLTTPDPSGAALAQVLSIALERAGVEPEQIGWIHAHGTATAYNDPVEIAALRRVFGRKMPPVTATKGTTGHLLGASGAVALGLTLEALRGGFIPPIAGLEVPSPEFGDIGFVMGLPRKVAAHNALVLNHGFGGHMAATVLGVGR